MRERLENPFLVMRGNARSFVTHFKIQTHGTVDLFGSHTDVDRAVGRMAQGIAQQVQQDLTQPLAIDQNHAWQTVGDIQLDPVAL